MVIISICEKQINLRSSTQYEFSFSGQYRGEPIRKINVISQSKLIVGEEYLLIVSVDEVVNSMLNTQLIRYTELKNISFLI